MAKKLADLGKRRHRGRSQKKVEAKASTSPAPSHRRYERLSFPTGHVGRPRKEDPVGVL